MKKIRLSMLFVLTLLFVIVSAEEIKTPQVEPIGVKELVKCVFVNSDSMQKCYTNDGKFGCSGEESCIIEVTGEKGKKLIWKSSCEKERSTTIDGNQEYAEFICGEALVPATAKEAVKCVFVNSQEIQECYSEDHRFSCSGAGACTMEVAGQRGDKVTWRSSCAGMAYTAIDGNMDYAEFDCNSKSVNPRIKEKVKCFFIGSKVKQECYAADAGPAGCSGVGSCIAETSAEGGTKITWKSSCGGYAYSTMDGADEGAEFRCIPENEVTPDVIKGKGFRYIYWQCHDGIQQKQGNENNCKNAEALEELARTSCAGHCNEDGSKCGINLLSVIENCYLDSVKKDVFVPSFDEKSERKMKAKENVLICKDSCPLNSKCYPFGYRKSGTFCSDDGSFINQTGENIACENSFECSSNLCVNGKCVSSGFIEKVMNWFKAFLG